MASEDPKFACPSCGKQYRWKPEMAGRTAKCGCGTKLTVPTQQPTAAPQPVKPAAPVPPPTPAAAPAASCPGCGAALSAGAVLCIQCGYNLKTGKTLAPVVVESGGEEDDDEDEEVVAEQGTAKDGNDQA